MSIQSINPATGEILETLERDSGPALEKILALAHEAFLQWRSVPVAARAPKMREAGRLLRARRAEYARTMTLEMGKPIVQGEAEVDKCAWACEYYADHAESLLAEPPRETDASRSYVRFDPLGPVLAVMPWNFPFWQVFRFAAPALMAGNAGILKHASNVPRCALDIEAVFREAGFPRGLFATALIGSSAVGALVADPRIVAATLTGSEHAGSKVAEQAGRALKKTVLELGGAIPSSSSRTPISQRRPGRPPRPGSSTVARAASPPSASSSSSLWPTSSSSASCRTCGPGAMGDPLARDTQVGPQARVDLRDDLHRQVAESVKRGAKLLLGGEIPSGPGVFYPPTLLAAVDKGMPAFDEEDCSVPSPP